MVGQVGYVELIVPESDIICLKDTQYLIYPRLLYCLLSCWREIHADTVLSERNTGHVVHRPNCL